MLNNRQLDSWGAKYTVEDPKDVMNKSVLDNKQMFLNHTNDFIETNKWLLYLGAHVWRLHAVFGSLITTEFCV